MKDDISIIPSARSYYREAVCIYHGVDVDTMKLESLFYSVLL